MKKTVFHSAILAAIVSLTFTPLASAHDMGSDDNPNFDFVDDQVSENHDAIIADLTEDGDLMGITYQGSGAEESTTAMGDGANSVETTAQSAAQTDVQSVTAVGRGLTSSVRTAGSRR
jgi:hypothetical protein